MSEAIAKIRELNEVRTRLGQNVKFMGAMNSPLDPEKQLQSAAQYKLAHDAWLKAESEYRAAINGLSAVELAEIASSPSQGGEK